MAEVKRTSLVKPTLKTRFHIDFDWWRKNDQDWHVYLFSNLCMEHQQAFADQKGDIMVDWVDPATGEVQRVDGLQSILISHCAKQEEFITAQTTLVDAVFRVFLANGNVPLNSIELGERLRKSPEMILRTFSGIRVYRGIRPCMD